jgi:hypothetical protein
LRRDVAHAERVALRESAPGQEFEPFRFEPFRFEPFRIEQTDDFFHVVFVVVVFEGN